jgi:peptide/nickel transport system permease protein
MQPDRDPVLGGEVLAELADAQLTSYRRAASGSLLREVLRSWQARIGVTLLVGYACIVAAGVIWHPDANAITAQPFASPSLHHLFGTDALARDIFRRVIQGGGLLILTSLCAALIAVTLGGALGGFVAYKRGLLDFAIMRGVDVLLSIPVILYALLTSALLPPGYRSLCLLVGLLQVLPVTRVCRNIFGDVFEREFLLAAALRGEPAWRLIVREAVPNVVGPLFVEFALRWNLSLLLIASLNFLGVGVQPPTADWGLMLFEGRNTLVVAPWSALVPAVFIAGLAVAINFTADGVAQVFNFGAAGTRRA